MSGDLFKESKESKEAEEGISVTSGLEFAKPTERLIPTKDPSKKVEAKGTIEPSDVHIFLTEEILKDVVSWSQSDLNHELGGVFVGSLGSSSGASIVIDHTARTNKIIIAQMNSLRQR